MIAKCLTGAALTLALTLSPALAQDQASKKFLTEAIQGNLAEVQMGKLAQQNGESADVKSFGQMLEKDHAAANEKAIEAAKSAGVTAPTEPSATQKADYDKMAKMKGAAFDRAFAKEMVAGHKKNIAAYEKEAKKTDAVASYAKDALPTLQKHLQTAQSIESATATTGQKQR